MVKIKPSIDPERAAEMVGEVIRARRDALDWTQGEAGDRAGIHTVQWYKAEKGIGSPTLRQLLRISAVLGCRVSDLLLEAGL